ncbi:hypothetical protein ACQZ61_05285 [Agrobacterium vitis]|uniref:hypothetical protein n=1 Tax=Agrobacterium vitis TaxID=373 RepID=UPI0015DB2109|nr:hypothetical protein [Agrobacterium vitis]BCH55506.1 hypothetical protein RvVAR031_31160 [Agrobacterium vitis]
MFWPELERGEVLGVFEDGTRSDIGLSAVFLAGRLANAKARAFADFVEKIVD